jgi:undecaprenyl-diphosphatase
MDTALLHALNGFAFRHDALEDPVTLYESASLALFLAFVVVLVASGGRRRRAGVAAGLGAGVALAIGQVVARLADRPRPFVADPSGVHLFARHAADASFPSDHATAAFAIGTAVLLRNRRLGVAVLVLAGVLAAGRVALGVHYPSDVLAGAVLGSAVSLVLHRPALRTRIDALADGLRPAWRRLRAATRTSP